MNLAKGMRLKVIKGIPQTDRAAWMETGDIVTVKEIYPHHVLVERSHRGRRREMMRECFTLNGIYNYLRPIRS